MAELIDEIFGGHRGAPMGFHTVLIYIVRNTLVKNNGPRWRGIATEDDGVVPVLPEEDLAITSSTVAESRSQGPFLVQPVYASAWLGSNNEKTWKFGAQMKITELLLAELDREAVGIRKTLERVPEGKNDWKPHEKSMSPVFWFCGELSMFSAMWSGIITPSMPLATGSRLGPYEITVLLGAGGMGEVYGARDTRLDRTVALKILPLHRSDQEEARERFEREARAIAALNHPNICQLYDVGSQDGVNYLVLEYLQD